jgi:hypothetical protein
VAALPIRWVLIRDPLRRFDPQALLCTDPNMTPLQVVQHFVRRWQVEVTFAETRRHLGVETQRQWSGLAIARTTPVLLGLFSLVTLMANRLVRGGKLPMRQAAWYVKAVPTFSDALAAVRAHWWRAIGLSTSRCDRDIISGTLLFPEIEVDSEASRDSFHELCKLRRRWFVAPRLPTGVEPLPRGQP